MILRKLPVTYMEITNFHDGNNDSTKFKFKAMDAFILLS